jgi:cytochrome P450
VRDALGEAGLALLAVRARRGRDPFPLLPGRRSPWVVVEPGLAREVLSAGPERFAKSEAQAMRGLASALGLFRPFREMSAGSLGARNDSGWARWRGPVARALRAVAEGPAATLTRRAVLAGLEAERGAAVGGGAATDLLGICARLGDRVALATLLGEPGDSAAFSPLLHALRCLDEVSAAAWVGPGRRAEGEAARRRLEAAFRDRIRAGAAAAAPGTPRGPERALALDVASSLAGEACSLQPPVLEGEIVRELLVAHLAGTEPLGSLACWALLRLAAAPDWEGRVLADPWAQAPAPGSGPPHPSRLVEAVIREALRLHPPVWLIGREARADGSLGAARLQAGDLVLVLPWLSHRQPQLFPEPERFDPGRFLGPGAAAAADALLAFGAGPRHCPGRELAVVQSGIVLATLVERLRVEPLAAAPAIPRARLGITLRPAGPVPVRLHWRDG